MKPKRISYPIQATSANGIALSQTPTGAGNLTLNGGLIANGALTLAVPQFMTITVAADESAKTFTIYGTNAAGASISESITGPATASTATSTKTFKTITRIAVSAATAAAVTAGVSGTSELPWVPLDHFIKPFEVSYYVNVTGTATYQVESTLDDVQNESITPVVNATVKASGSTSGGGTTTNVASALRIKVTASTGSPVLVFNVMQSGR